MQQILQDVKRITTDATEGFAIPVTFADKNGISVTVNALHTRIHLAIDTEGEFINAQKAKVTVSELALVEAGYVTRDAKNNCILKDHKVTLTDIATQVVTNYVIKQIFPDETTGLIVCMLNDSK